MCGIAGIIGCTENGSFDSALNLMLDQIVHRGPDDSGVFHGSFAQSSARVALGHRRLSIIDLEAGHQPLANADGSIQIVFNGEIYNYRELRQRLISAGRVFATNSDTEVIIAAYEEYGDECVEYLRGMFAFAIFDARQGRVFIARDRFGKKPLFYAHTDQGLIFASEIKALLATEFVGEELDYDGLWDYFSYRYVPGPRTLFSSITKLPPGHTLVVDAHQKTSITSYYSPFDQRALHVRKIPEDPVGTFLDLLEQAVEIRMVSDVPFGAFLSGGIDSSAVVALMSKHSSTPIRTFSVGFDESEYSELAYAGDIARHFKTEHTELTISAENLMQELPKLIRYRDAPVAEPSDIPIYLLAVEASKSVKMVLTGEGSDEILGGYPKHVFESYAQYYQYIPDFLRKHFIERCVAALPYKFRRAKTAITNLGIESFEDRMAGWFGALSPSQRTALISDFAKKRRTEGSSLLVNSDENASPLRRILHFDQTSWLPDNLLERGDRMTMAASIEARMPLMDHKLAEFASSLPDNFRVRGRQTKWILREAMKSLLPREILERPKVGFRVPVNEWFRGEMKDYLHETLCGTQSMTKGFYQVAALEKYIADHASGRQNHEKILWSLLNLELWYREYLPST